jgi:ribonuclease Z
MRRTFLARLVNGPFEDPAVFVALVRDRRAFLFDLGEVAPLSVREVLRVGDVFVSHTHMDHFAGFDRLLRLMLGRDLEVRLWGPPGLIERVGHKLQAYTWNLVEGYAQGLAFAVTELHTGGEGGRARFSVADGFTRRDQPSVVLDGGVLFDEPNLCATAALLDHGIPCLGFALQEKLHINVRKSRLHGLGLAKGPWLRDLKELVVSGAPDDRPVSALRAEAGRTAPRVYPLGFLKEQLLDVVPGDRIAYVTDVAWTEANAEAIVALARGAELLFIEAPFLDRERDRAAARRHLTARQAGMLARRAGVRRVVPFHFSPRHVHEEAALYLELDAAFAGGQG